MGTHSWLIVSKYINMINMKSYSVIVGLFPNQVMKRNASPLNAY